MKFQDAGRRQWHVSMEPAAAGLSKLRNQFSQSLFLSMGAVGVVLLIACANIASLLLVRAAARRGELATRLALGARPSRLAMQLLAESLLLATMGGALGIQLARWTTKLLVVFLSVGPRPIVLDLHPDARVLSFTALVSIVAGLLFGLAPVLSSVRIDLCSALKGAGNTSRASNRLRPGKILAVLQVAFSLLLLIGAGLFVRSLQNLNGREAGISRKSVSIIRVDAKPADWRDIGELHRLDNLYKDLLQTVKDIPGVRLASLAQVTPSKPNSENFEGLRFPSGKFSEPIGTVVVYPDYFSTVGIPLVEGRDFSSMDNRDNSPSVCIVNEAFARKMYPGENAIGKPCIHSNRPGAIHRSGQPYEIVGIVKNSRQMNPTGTVFPLVYTTFLETSITRHAMVLYVQMSGNPNVILPRIRLQVSKIDPTLPQLEVHTLARDMDAALIKERLVAMLSTLFGALALLLACVGLYGLLAFAVVQRTMEVGIRMALGASRPAVVWMIMQDALKLVAIGIALGVPVALGLARVASNRFPDLFGSPNADPALAAIKTDIAGLLFGVKATDPITIVAAVVVLSAAAAVAAYFPARRASRVDPIVALRAD